MMKITYPELFTPISIRGITLKNRILSAPLGLWSLVPEDGVSAQTLRFWSERAAGGAATVVFGDTQVNVGDPEEDRMGFSLPIMTERAPRALLSSFADCVHRHGALASIELNHAGYLAKLPPGVRGFGPSERKGPFGEYREMSQGEIDRVVAQFAGCARTMKQLGFKMVTIHGGHDKLIDSFFNPAQNHRRDAYGGSLENRMRLCVEVCEAVRAAVGERFIIELRISSRDPEKEPELFEETIALIKRLEGVVDIVNTSVAGMPPREMTSDEPATEPSYLVEPGVNAYRAAAVKKRVNMLVSAVGAINSPRLAEKILAAGQADFVVMGRPLIADPELPKKARRGLEAEIRPCIACGKCLQGMHDTHLLHCAVNPRIGREMSLSQPPERVPERRVVVVGGGIAGMQAALTAAQRGHSVTLFEKKAQLGGICAALADDVVEGRVGSLGGYYRTLLAKTAVDVRLNTEATAETVKALAPEAIVLATGSEPVRGAIPGDDGENVLDLVAAYEQPERIGHRVVIVGGNRGCELALTLLRAGHEVTIVEKGDLLRRTGTSDTARLRYYIRDVNKQLNTVCTRILPDSVVLERDGAVFSVEADTVVLANGRVPVRGLAEALRFEAEDFYEVGDCTGPASVGEAIKAAYFAALDI